MVSSQVTSTFATIFWSLLRSVSYRLPSRAAGFHTVRILPTHNLDLKFRSRSGYYDPNRVQ
jgi:hypothetical protein